MDDEECPGMYCGINPETKKCGACPWGYRKFLNNYSSICKTCEESPEYYDWLYLIFMAALPLFYNWYYIDLKVANQCLSKKLIFSALLETVLSSVFTILIMDPMWTFHINSCPIYSISDWYTFMFNPNPNYDEYIYCTQEVVYPLYTIVFVYYIFGVLGLLFIRPWFARNLPSAISVTYAGFYLYPILAAIHAVFCGFIHYTFPYIVILVSVIFNCIHFAIKLNQSMDYLLKDTVTNGRNLFIVIVHWICHAFGIIGLTKTNHPLHYGLLCLVPVPTIFYILTSTLTNPRKINND